MVNFKKLRQMIEVKGNGNIVSREISVSSFLRLHLAGKGIVELIQSDEEKVLIETDENLLEFYDVQNSGRTLFVTSEGNFRRPVPTKSIIRIYLRQLDILYVRNDRADLVCAGPITLNNPLEVKLQTVGNTTLNIVAPSIRVLNQSTGDVTFEGRCGIITIKNQGVGHFNSAGLLADELTLKNMGEGNIDLFAEKTISISHYGSGYVHYAGNATLKDVKQYGSGEVKHVKNPTPAV